MSPAETDSAIPYVDLHVDLPYQHNYKDAAFLRGTGQFAATMAKEAGLYAVVLPLFVPVVVSKQGPRVSDYEQSWRSIEAVLNTQKIYAHPGGEPASGQIRTFYSFEGMGPIGDDLSSLEIWVHRGVRLFGLVHNQHNALAASAMDSRGDDFGLTSKGRQVVSRIYELGGVVDISHASDRAGKEVIEIALKTGQPVVASHSNARHLLDHRRQANRGRSRSHRLGFRRWDPTAPGSWKFARSSAPGARVARRGAIGQRRACHHGRQCHANIGAHAFAS